MKKSRLLGALSAAVLSFITLPSQAALTHVLGGQAVYDDVADLSWTTNANINGLMNWAEANTWAANLDINGVTGWRLPDTLQPDASCSGQVDPGGGFGVQGFGAGCTGSEMGNMYNVEGVTDAAPGLFSNVQSDGYWSSTEYVPNPVAAWYFAFDRDDQFTGVKVGGGYYAWAVQSGDVSAVPVPATVWLFGSGLLVLIGVAREKRPDNHSSQDSLRVTFLCADVCAKLPSW
jgi:hypothetical protein